MMVSIVRGNGALRSALSAGLSGGATPWARQSMGCPLSGASVHGGQRRVTLEKRVASGSQGSRVAGVPERSTGVSGSPLVSGTLDYLCR